MIVADWFNSSPEDWPVARVSDHAVVLNGYPFDSERFSTSEGIPLVRIRDIASEKTEVGYAGEPIPEAVIRRGDILIGMDGDFNVARWKGEDALLNQRVCCVRPRPTVDDRYLAYLLPFPLKLINEFTYSTTVKHLSSFDVLKIRFPLPSLEVQRSTADYLDRETAQIDALVAAKERLLALLAEKRRALITRAVTRGLDPTVSLRDSGLPWLGEVPAHWKAVRVKFILSGIDHGGSPQCHNTPAEDGQWGVLKTGCVNGGVFNPAENKALPEEVEPVLEWEVKPGDVLMSRASGSTDLIGSVALVRNRALARLLLSDKTFRLRLISEMCNSAFFVVAMGSTKLRHQITQAISGAEGLANNIAQSDIRELLLPLPPLAEQRAIVAHIAAETARLDALAAATERTIALLKERRAALIAAAVTGQITVPHGVTSWNEGAQPC